MYCILIGKNCSIRRDELMSRLKEKGIDTRTFFIPMHQQSAFLNRGLFKGERYPVAEELSYKGLYSPSSGLKEEEIENTCQAIKDAIRV